jgi:O-antigen/teichoic acid export membrane protein
MSATQAAVAAATPSAGSLARRSAKWILAGQVASQGLRLVTSVVLARLLFPEAFGLMAVVAAFLFGLQMFSDVGVGPSIVQSERGDDPAFLRTAWTIQVLRGAAVAAGAVALSWPVAAFYGEPQLRPLLAVSGLRALVQGFQSVAGFRLQRRLTLGPVVRLEVVAQVVQAVVTVAWALVHRSVWALVGGMLVGSAVSTVLGHLWLPAFRHRFHWDRDAARRLSRFGRWIFLSSVLAWIALQTDRILLGRFLGLATLGVYSVALRFTEALGGLQARLTHSVMFPLFSTAARSDPAALADRYYRVRRRVDPLLLPLSALLAVGGDWVVDLLYDPRYEAAGWMLRVVAVHVALSFVVGTHETLLTSLGESRYGFFHNLTKTIWMTVGVPLSWALWGLQGVLWCVASVELSAVPVLSRALARRGLLRVPAELRTAALWAGGVALGLALRAALL